MTAKKLDTLTPETDIRCPTMVIRFLFLSYFLLVCQGNEYWVRPNTTVDCPTGVPTQRCVTLLNIAANNSRYFVSNTQINFLAGVHYIQSDNGIDISNIGTESSFNISLVGDHRARTTIHCNGTQMGFRFGDIHNFALSNIELIHCGGSHDNYGNVSVLLVNTQRVVISGVVIQNSTGTGLLITGAGTSVLIMKSRFQGNQFVYGNAFISTSVAGFNLKILNCVFEDGTVTRLSDHHQNLQSVASGLTILVAGYYKETSITIRNSSFHNNIALTGGHLTINMQELSVDLEISTCKFTKADSYNTGAVNIFCPVGNLQRTAFKFVFKNCIVENNTGGGLKVRGYGEPFSSILMIIHNNIFKHNTAEDGAALHVDLRRRSFNERNHFSIDSNKFVKNTASNHGGAIFMNLEDYYSPIKFKDGSLKIVRCEFRKNAATRGSAISYKLATTDRLHAWGMNTITSSTFTRHNDTQSAGSVIHLSNTELDINNTKITDNNCRGMHLNMSILNIKGNVWINQNKAQYGAGIFLDYDPPEFCKLNSRITISCACHLHIKDNNAVDYGGGLMVRSGCAVPELCFIQPSQCTGMIHMSGNTAGIAGTVIYGGDLENCFLKSLNNAFTPEQFWAIFNITERHSGPSVVASQPYKVCICNDNFSTDHSCVFHYNVKVYPGQTFTVPVVGVGQYNYSSPAVIRAVAPQGVKLGEQQVTQETRLICTNLSFSLQTDKKDTMIKLLIETQISFTSTIQPQHAFINVTILDCPLGFQLDETLQVCHCLPHLSAKSITCDIFTQTLHKPPSTWIGNFSNDIVAHNNCPFDYCDPGVQDVRLASQDDQCNWNRTGILCGTCRDGYSIVLGTSRCQECSNIYLLLLLPISLAGLGLVVLLLKCNLTVSTGTLNGLIFYANIVQVNSKLFFSSYPPGPMSTLSYVLSVFIAWINLDMGIEVCFAENLNTFSQTWLQFLFPVYIWCIIGLLIIVCRYSTTVSRLTGSNTVSVLATLFLLSYAKLLRTTLNIFSPITITDPNNTPHLRWILDANYGFLHWPHLALFLAALFTLVLHLIPFTALLLFGPTLQAHTNYRLLSWVTRIKPFLDAYHGPYKTKYRYWTGFMLLVRMLLLTVFAGNALGDPNINLLTIVVTVLTVLVVWIKIGRIYRKWPINVLEVSYLLNLEITAVATLYLRASSSSDTQQQTLSLITVGSALLVFIAVMIYHCCSVLTETRRGRKLKQKILNMYQNRATTQEEDEVVEPQVRASSPTRSEVNLRELLLEDKD